MQIRRINVFCNSILYKVCFFSILFIVASVLILKKCAYGFGNIDEAFYLTIPYRLVQGDALLVDEWHVSQLSGFLLYPIMKLFLKLNVGTEGMMIAFRYICTIIIIVSALVIFLLSYRISFIGAAMGSLMYLLYIPFGVIALSYNSMGIIFMSLSAVLFSSIKGLIPDILSGVFFASAVLCCPHLVLIWFLYLTLTIVLSAKHVGCCDFLNYRRFLPFSFGCIILALIFTAFVLSRAEVKDVITALPYILADPGHSYSLFTKVKLYFLGILTFNNFAPIYYFCFVLLLILNKVFKNKYKILFLFINVILTLVFLIFTFFKNHYINFLMFPINFLGLFCFLTFKEENTGLRNVFHGIWIPGFLYTICINLASDQVIFAVSSVSTVSLIASILIIANTISSINWDENQKKQKIVLILFITALFGIQICSEAYLRWTQIFWEPGLFEQTEKIDCGVDKGLIVSKGYKELYYNYLDDLNCLDESTENVLFLSDYTWLYLCGNWKNASLSSWLNDIDDIAINRLIDYYSINPKKLPDTIYASPETKNYAIKLADYLGYEFQMRTPNGSLIFTNA